MPSARVEGIQFGGGCTGQDLIDEVINLHDEEEKIGLVVMFVDGVNIHVSNNLAQHEEVEGNKVQEMGFEFVVM